MADAGVPSLRIIDAARETPPGRRPPLRVDDDGLQLLQALLASIAKQESLERVLTDIVNVVTELLDADAVVLEVPAPGLVLAERIVVHRSWPPSGLTDWSSGSPPDPPAGGEDIGVTGIEIPLAEGRYGRLRVRAGATYTGGRHRSLVLEVASSAVALVVDNATRHAQARHRERWLAAVVDIAALLTDPDQSHAAVRAVCDRARHISGADVAWVMTTDGRGGYTMAATSAFDAEQLAYAMNRDLSTSFSAEVIRRGAAMLSDDLPPVVVQVHQHQAWQSLGPVMMMPASFGATVEGMLGLAWTPARIEEFRAVDRSLVHLFSELAALAIRISTLPEAARRLALLEDHQRTAEELHDTVIQRLFAIGLALDPRGVDAAADRPTPSTPPGGDALTLLDQTILDIRHATSGYAVALSGHDLAERVTTAVGRSRIVLGFPPEVDVRLGAVRGLPAGVEADLMAALAQGLDNVARHAHATSCRVTVSLGAWLVLEVVDDGRGLPPSPAERGLRALRERAEAHGGILRLRSGASGCVLTWSVPLGGPPPGG